VSHEPNIASPVGLSGAAPAVRATDGAVGSVGRQIARGSFWMLGLRACERSLGLISTVVLARLLTPSDFGLVTMATSIVAVTELLSSFGFDFALIHRVDAERRHFDTAWTLNVLTAACSAAILLALAWPAAVFYREPRLRGVIELLAAALFVEGFQNIGLVAFRKKLDFRKDFAFLFGKRLIVFAVTVPLAIVFRNYWALVVGILAGRASATVLSYIVQSYRPTFSLAAVRELLGFSRWLLLNNVIWALRFRSTDFVIGRLAGSQALGLYSAAYEISNLPTSELVAPLNRAIFPGYAKLASDMPQLRRGFLSVVSVIAACAFPISAGMVVTAALLVPVLLGRAWMDTVPLIHLLVLYGLLVALQANTSSVYLALGRPNILTIVFGWNTLALVLALLWMVPHQGVVGAARAVVVVASLAMPLNYFLVLRLLDLSVWRLCAVMWRPAVAAAVMAVVLRFMIDHWSIQGNVLGLAESVLTGAIVYAVLLLTLWLCSGRPSGPEQIAISALRG
jgi:O-antigen/teichoic acid export membrane protein